MKKYLFALMATLILSSPAFATGYGDAGCGLGSMLFGDAPGPIQIFAATTNYIGYGGINTQSVGISLGTSNCDAEGFDTAQKEQERYVADNFSGIAKEMATGEGEQLTVLAGLMGCPTVSQQHFNTVIQDRYSVIFVNDSTGPLEMLSGVKTVVSNDAELSSACTIN